MLVRYRHLVIEDPLGLPEPEELEAVEQALGVPLPTSFREFLAVAHGGMVDDFIIEAEGEEITLGRVFRVGRDERNEYGYYTLLGQLAMHRSNPHFPKHVLPFAEAAAPLYLDLTVKGADPVVAFLHGLPEWAGSRREDRYVVLAPSFDAFLDRLQEDSV